MQMYIGCAVICAILILGSLYPVIFLLCIGALVIWFLALSVFSDD